MQAQTENWATVGKTLDEIDDTPTSVAQQGFRVKQAYQTYADAGDSLRNEFITDHKAAPELSGADSFSTDNIKLLQTIIDQNVAGATNAADKQKWQARKKQLDDLNRTLGLDQDGDMTMPELAGALADATGVQAHPDAIGRFLRKLGFTYKSKEDQKTIQ